MIIECPACNTRYDIKVDLPPDGRTVRCAKCEHVWRATAIEEDDDYSAGDAEAPGEEEASDSEASEAGQFAAGWDDEEEETQVYSHGYEPAAAVEEDEEPRADSPGFLDPEPADENGGDGEEEAGREQIGAKVSWFGSFMRKGPKTAPATQSVFDDPEPVSAEPLPFLRPAPAPAPVEAEPPSDSHVRTLDDARAAVRNVFASLGEQRPHQNASSIQAPVTAYEDEEHDAFPSFMRPAEPAQTATSEWESEPSGEAGFIAGQTMEAPSNAATWSTDGAGQEGAATAAPQGWFQNWQPEQEAAPEARNESEIDAQLRAALQAHFPPHTASGGLDHGQEPQFEREPASETTEAAISEALTAFWQRPAPIRGEPLAGSPPRFDEDGEAAGEVTFDERLFRELEETQEHSGPPRYGEPRGALALAAAWGLFLCVAGGLTGGLLGFRDIAADTIPGLASFYRAVGLHVTVQPLIFEGVQYEWGVSEFKPVLHIKGAVFNRAARGVMAPQFIVSIKDNDPALDKEFPATLSIAGEKIQSEERAEFDIELLSPSQSITAVELEMRDIR
jgi:predicted Zn finger-like uncharacterized protein